MKKVLFIAPYRQTDEWGEKARTLASMINEHADLTLRPIWFNSEVNPNMHLENMEELENKNEQEFDIVIQFGLPNHFAYDGRFKKNIAITSFGCVHKNIDVSSVLNLFDKVAVFSSNEIEYAFRSGIPNNKIINFGCDPFIPTPNPNTNFDFGVEGLTFYTMAGLSPDSGLRETLAAYLSIPRDEDKTTLAVVTNHPEEVKKEIQRTQEILGICAPTEYRKIAICNPTDAKDSRHYKDQAHLAFDVFINVGYNASQCKDTLLAYSADNRVISPRSHNFYKNYTDKVKTIEEICLHPAKPLPYMFTGNTTWHMPIIRDLQVTMKRVMKAKHKTFSGLMGVDQRDRGRLRLNGCLGQFKKQLEDLLCTQ